MLIIRQIILSLPSNHSFPYSSSSSLAVVVVVVVVVATAAAVVVEEEEEEVFIFTIYLTSKFLF